MYQTKCFRLAGIAWLGLCDNSGKMYLAHVVPFLVSVFQVANLACSISNNEEGVKLVRMAATQIDSLCPQVRTLKSAFTANIDICKEALVTIFWMI